MPWKLKNMLNTIDRIWQKVSCKEVNHVFSKMNSIHDVLAKKGCDRNDAIWDVHGGHLIAYLSQ